MKVLFFTREFPPYVYGGAGVHVEYLADELAKLMKIDVRSFGDQDTKNGNLTVK
ncbi:MAG: glycogen synthase, partial [Lutibacter sp.]|nr:glycogen synthase [Lutibacter sp.]